MNINQLDDYLRSKESSLPPDFYSLLLEERSKKRDAFPFGEWEFRTLLLIQSGVISLEEYLQMRNQHLDDNTNLNLFSMGPRHFGETWAQEHIRNLDKRFKKPSKKVDPDFKNQYDLLFGKQKIEIKAARAFDLKHTNLPPTRRALKSESDSDFWLNFQQLKPNCADIFVFIGVWTNSIRYWVFSKKEISSHPKFKNQHRDGVEGQIGIRNKDIELFQKYEVTKSELIKRIEDLSKKR